MSKKRQRSRKSTTPATPPPNDYWSGLSLRTRHLLCAAVMVLLPFFLFHDVIVGGQQFMAHDTVQWRAGADSIIEHREETGEEPLWATNMFSGMPAYVVSYAKSVPSLDTLLYDTTSSLFPYIPYLVLLFGCYFFFTLMGMRPLAALFGSILIAFTTYLPIVVGAGHNTKVYTFSFIPWMLSGYWLVTRSNRPLWALFLLVLALSLQLRAGHPQVTYYFFYMVLIWWLWDGYQAWRGHTLFPRWVKITGLLAAAAVIALMCNMQHFWSLMEYSPHSIRGGSELVENADGLDQDYAMSWSQGRGELFTLLIPELYGGNSSGNTYWGPKPVTSGPHYFGAIAFLLFFFGLFQSINRIRLVFLGVGTLTMLFALGEHFQLLNYFMFDHAAWFDRFRTPEMWLIVTIVCFSIIAALGAAELLNRQSEMRQQGLRALYWPGGITLGLALIFTLAGPQLLSFEKPNERQQLAQQVAQQQQTTPDDPQVQQRVEQFIQTELVPDREDKARSDSQRTLILVVLGLALLGLFLSGRLAGSYAMIGLVLLAAADLLSVGSRYISDDSKIPSEMSRQNVIEQQARDVDRFIAAQFDNDRPYSPRAFPLLDDPFNNAVPSYFYPSIGGYTGAKLARYQDVIDHALFEGQAGINLALLNMLNVRYMTAPQPYQLPGFEVAHEGQEGYVLENTDALPRAFFVESLTYADSPRQAMDAINDPGFDPSREAVVETGEQLTARQDPQAEVRVTEYGPREIRLQYEREGDGFLVLSEVYYPAGWTARVNGQEVDIHPANYILRGLQVPGGQHEVVLRFDPQSYYLGSTVSWIGHLIILLIGLGAAWSWHRHEYRPERDKEQASS